MKNLNDLGVQEMDAMEMKKTDGGFNYLVLQVAIWAVGEYHDMKRGCEDALREWAEQ
ncbi:hypothetical protein SAMN06265379_103225 [Saccharicrinis carchari]|uniref:Uncharacterized protein n=1 Tax=Saccharicrinis carchari TaxID=1168039 RepID=A0A521CKG6_SACCC|nr:hypothetical protein [Saccharicrinis carchari]SMO59914.1 hypothetical protein SAMN06265379_103225 [Saccharicrinis carchari]